MCVLCSVSQASTALHGYSPSIIFFFASLYISLEITPVSKSLWLICNSISLMHSLDNSYPDVINIVIILRFLFSYQIIFLSPQLIFIQSHYKTYCYSVIINSQCSISFFHYLSLPNHFPSIFNINIFFVSNVSISVKSVILLFFTITS